MRLRIPGIWIILLPAIAAALFAACGSDEERTISKVFQAAPWQGAETLTYNLSRRGEPSAGACVLTTEPDFEPGKTRLRQSCTSDQHTDEGSVVVDAQTLKPDFATRIATDAEKNRRTTWTNTYEAIVVRFEADTNGSVSRTTRDLPKPSPLSPDPGWYEDGSLLWLVRGLPLRDGFAASYMHVINAGQPRVLPVDISIESPQAVKVPAGTFTAWRVLIKRENTTYSFWVDQQAPQRVVKARIEDVTYELTAVK